MYKRAFSRISPKSRICSTIYPAIINLVQYFKLENHRSTNFHFLGYDTVLLGNWFPKFRSHYVPMIGRETIRTSVSQTLLLVALKNNHESSHPC